MHSRSPLGTYLMKLLMVACIKRGPRYFVPLSGVVILNGCLSLLFGAILPLPPLSAMLVYYVLLLALGAQVFL